VDLTHLDKGKMAPDSSSIPPFPQRVVIYALAILLAVGGAVVGVRWFGLRGEESLILECALLFLIAGSGRAPRLFGAVRQARYFSEISSDRVMRSVLVILAVLMFFAVLVRRALFPTT
jgi:hypothetical protein